MEHMHSISCMWLRGNHKVFHSGLYNDESIKRKLVIITIKCISLLSHTFVPIVYCKMKKKKKNKAYNAREPLQPLTAV